jgi:hypothetical protein
LDPSIAAIPFRVHRRQETVNSLGRSVLAIAVYPAIGGVVPAGSSTLHRDPERDFSERGITVYTRFRLQLTSPGYKPDLIEWPIDTNNLWLVNHLSDYTQYGAGFTEAQCVLFDPEHLDPATAA